jgi:peptidoglycan/xylan/chitin deacetylase (PgdA/CDA1 family)
MRHARPIAIRCATATAIVCVAATVRAAAGFSPAATGVISHGPREVPMVALTFDACPTRAPVELDERIVDALVKARAPATFFVSGRWAQRVPNAVRRLAAEPLFEIGNHTWGHPHLRPLDEARIRTELTETQAELQRLTGRPARWFRAPFGEVDLRIAAIAAGVGLGTIEFDVASGDPAPGVTKTALVASVLQRVRPGSIVVMHANHRRFPTADAVPEIVAGLRARGLEPVTVSRLLAR